MGRPLDSRVTGVWLITLITLLDGMNSCWFGYDQGVFAGVLVSPDFLRQFPSTADANVSGFTTSSFLLGAALGSVLASFLGDQLGRRKTVAAGLLCNVAGTVLQMLSWALAQMIAGRIVNGVGIGLCSTVSPVYLSECASSRVRGKLMAVGACCNVGFFALAYWIAYGLHGDETPFQWRFPLAFQLVLLLVVVPVLAVVPESPRWLLLVDRSDEALRVLAQLAGRGASVEDPVVLAEFRSIKSAIQIERDHKVPLWDVLCLRDATQNFRRVLLSCGTQFMQQFSGINAFGTYLPTLLQNNVGYDQEKSRLLAAISATLYTVCSFGCLLFIDRLGRRKMMILGPAALGICFLIASICLKTGDDDPSRRVEMGKVTVAMIILYHVFFGFSFASVPWVYSAEVNSLGWRTRGAAAATATNWLGGFAVVQFTKAGLDNLHWRFFLMFAVLCFAWSPVVFLFYPETAHRTLEDMDQIFIQNPSPFVFNKPEMTRAERPQGLIDAEALRIARAENDSSEAVLHRAAKGGAGEPVTVLEV